MFCGGFISSQTRICHRNSEIGAEFCLRQDVRQGERGLCTKVMPRGSDSLSGPGLLSHLITRVREFSSPADISVGSFFCAFCGVFFHCSQVRRNGAPRQM